VSNDDEIARLQKRHDAIVKAVAEIPASALGAAAADLVEEMKHKAPTLHASTRERQPGELRDSIVATPAGQTTPNGQSVSPDSVVISAGSDQVPYGEYVEFGTSKMHAEPFFFPAIRQMALRTKLTITGAFKKAVDDAWAKQ
jgi:HK97 gp10 family phage protein